MYAIRATPSSKLLPSVATSHTPKPLGVIGLRWAEDIINKSEVIWKWKRKKQV